MCVSQPRKKILQSQLTSAAISQNTNTIGSNVLLIPSPVKFGLKCNPGNYYCIKYSHPIG